MIPLDVVLRHWLANEYGDWLVANSLVPLTKNVYMKDIRRLKQE